MSSVQGYLASGEIIPGFMSHPLIRDLLLSARTSLMLPIALCRLYKVMPRGMIMKHSKHLGKVCALRVPSSRLCLYACHGITAAGPAHRGPRMTYIQLVNSELR